MLENFTENNVLEFVQLYRLRATNKTLKEAVDYFFTHTRTGRRILLNFALKEFPVNANHWSPPPGRKHVLTAVERATLLFSWLRQSCPGGLKQCWFPVTPSTPQLLHGRCPHSQEWLETTYNEVWEQTAGLRAQVKLSPAAADKKQDKENLAPNVFLPKQPHKHTFDFYELYILQRASRRHQAAGLENACFWAIKELKT